MDTPAGRLVIAEREGRIVCVDVTKETLPAPHTPLQRQCARELAEYFAGQRRRFDVPLLPEGTPFQQQVWTALQSIPWGETRTYGEVARQLGMPGAARAVGGAIHRNPLLILIPCHRVVRERGLTGFRAGLTVKETLLALERGGVISVTEHS